MSELNGTLTSSVNLVGSFGGASTGTSDYNELSNKPSINGVELSGNKTGSQLNLVSDSDLATVATTGNYNDLLHKPVIPAAQVNSDWNSTSGVSAILNKPDIPAAQVNSDWNSDSGVSEILNKPTLSAVATSGDYDDLTNKPTIPVNSDFALSGLSDTDITTPTQPNQVLAYDSNGKVVNKYPYIYSTTEKVVGKWTDNRNVFEKVFEFNNVSVTAGSRTLLGLGIANLDFVIESHCVLIESSSFVTLPYTQISSFNTYGIFYGINKTDGLVISTGSDRSISGAKVYLVARYIKTS